MTNSEITEDDIGFDLVNSACPIIINDLGDKNKEEQLKQKIITALRLLDWIEQEMIRLKPLSQNSIERNDCMMYLKSLLNQAKGEKK